MVRTNAWKWAELTRLPRRRAAAGLLGKAGMSQEALYVLAYTMVLSAAAVDKVEELFGYVDAIIFPTRGVLDNYRAVLGGQFMARFPAVVAPHPDHHVADNYERVPLVEDGVCRIAFVGDFLPSKGAVVFMDAVKRTKTALLPQPCRSVQYYVFGEYNPRSNYRDVAAAAWGVHQHRTLW